VLYAYLTSTNYDFSYDRAKNLRPKRNIKTAMNHEILLYGIAQKEQLGFDKAVEECKYRMSRYGVTPNMLVLPPQMLLYMALAPEEKLTYKEGGPAAEARFEGGVAGFEARSFRGCGIVTSEPFEVSDDNESLQMLTRSSQVGEFYVMSPPQVPPKGEGDGHGLHTCDLLVYDEESDRHVRITWEDAMEATLVNDAEGFYTAAADTKMADGDQNTTTLSEWKAMAEEWSSFNKGTQSYAATLAKNAKNIDCRIIVARPFIEHLMHNVVMCVAGRDTGATLFGPADMQLSANTQVKTIEGHYTGHFKAVVTKPQNVLIMKDVACAGYVAGMNTRWFAKPERGGAMSADAAQENIQARLSFGRDDTDRYASMLAFPCLEGQFQSGQLDTVMSVTTRLLPWEVNNAGTHTSFPGGDAMFAKYNAALQLGQVHYGEDMKAAENQARQPHFPPHRTPGPSC